MKNMKENNFNILFLLCILFIVSCKKELNKNEYVKWVENVDNKLHKVKKMNNIVFDLQYKPIEYIALQKQLHANDNLNKIISNTEEMYYFNLKIKYENNNSNLLKKDVQSSAEYQERVYYYAYMFEKQIFLIIDSTKIPCKLYHFERSYDLSPNTSIILGFPKSNNQKNSFQLSIEPELLNTGIINFYFDKKTLENIPTLKYN